MPQTGPDDTRRSLTETAPASSGSSTDPARPAGPPQADVRPTERVHHGDVLVDDFEWLRDSTDPDVLAHLNAENAWTEAQTADQAELREAIFTDIRTRTRETDLTVPQYGEHETPGPDGTPTQRGYWYYTRTREGEEYRLYCRAPAEDRATPPDLEAGIPGEEVLLDGNAEDGEAAFFSIGTFSVSPDGTRLAFAVDRSGDERFTLRVRDLTSGQLLPDVVPDTFYGAEWAGNEHLFYTRTDSAWRPYQVLRHRLGTDPTADPLVWSEPDERYWLGVESSRDDRWLLFGSASKLTSEYAILATDDPEGTPRVIAPRTQGVEYSVEVAGDRLLVVHNDGATDFMLSEAPLEATDRSQWRTVLEHVPGVRLLGVEAYARHVVVSLRRDGLTALHVIPRDEHGDLGEGHDIAFDEPVHTVGSEGALTYDTPDVRLSYSSLVTPPTVYDYRFADGALLLRKQTPVLDHPHHGPYRPEDYRQERIWATAPDGTRVPISVVAHRSVPRDGSAPAVLYGYGSYEVSIDPEFSTARLSLLDRGYVYAIAHIRGGGELGRSWYEQGRTLTKRNTFTDFIACAEQLIADGWTSADRLAARGGSAGGLLMGAVANLAPTTFRAIHAAVPFVDNLTTILDPELPLTVIEWEEWGDPLHDPEVYAYMKSYAPYENVAPTQYPAILATTSLNDTRVLFCEPAKWVAELRRTATNAADDASGRPILLKTEMDAGHGGVSGRYRGWREVAFEYAWLISQTAPSER
ncbi:oligopeptidase B [Friedmanniella endophytica]|uniref:Oligopeptidase B n=1 Tax=Microlunatus kandeliicorticis TaxID=1759536 RepID=A0A7W3P6T5_9ACTN|nr:S9 family peptidase [Microlunatus kandeliicorticis]MBA8795391.1 oligopeptidase B [Microlunatus kandeliicorticis]